jgi:hypothetical protein
MQIGVLLKKFQILEHFRFEMFIFVSAYCLRTLGLTLSKIMHLSSYSLKYLLYVNICQVKFLALEINNITNEVSTSLAP